MSDQLIEFKRVGSRIEVIVHYGYPVSTYHSTTNIAYSNEFEAIMAYDNLIQHYGEVFKQIREQSYNKGWSDAKKKKKKTTWFSCFFGKD